MFNYLRAKFRNYGKRRLYFDGASLPSLIKAIAADKCQTPQVKFSGTTAKVHLKRELKDVSKKTA